MSHDHALIRVKIESLTEHWTFTGQWQLANLQTHWIGGLSNKRVDYVVQPIVNSGDNPARHITQGVAPLKKLPLCSANEARQLNSTQLTVEKQLRLEMFSSKD